MPAPETRTGVSVSSEQAVVGAGLLLVAAQVLLRGWASLHGWFYADDFELLADATGRVPGPSYLLTPHDSQLMPAGLLLAWLVAHAGAFDWTTAAVLLTALQAIASLCCLWLLVTLFGRRWACLPLLMLYLASPLTLTAFMWWSAAVNQVPVQAACFAALATHAGFLRTGRKRYALATVVLVAVGLCFYVKAVLILLPLAALSLLWPRTERRSLARAVRAQLPALFPLAVLVAGYAAYYVGHVPNPLSSRDAVPYGDLADAMFRRSLGPVLLGGPWRWSTDNPPLGRVATPAWAVTASWVVIAAAVTVAVLRRRGDWRALLVVVPYLGATYLLTAWGRGAQLGGFAGLALRYLADAAPVLVLALGLFALPLRTRPSGAPSRPPGAPSRPPGRRGRAGAVAATVLLTASALWSDVAYVRPWLGDYPARAFVDTALGESAGGPLTVLDTPVPELVQSATSYPSNLPSRLFRPVGDRIVAVTRGTDPFVLDSDGRARVPTIVGGARSGPGPAPGCGYAVSGSPVPVPLAGAPHYFWWLRIGYLAGADGELSVTLGGVTHRLPVEAGVHSVFLRGSGSVEDLSMSSADPTATVCVDGVVVGDVAAADEGR